MIHKYLILCVFLCGSAFSAINNPKDFKKPRWLLSEFIKLSEKQPNRILSIATKLFSPERLTVVSKEARHAHDWQNRAAMVSALSQFFNPEAQSKVTETQRSSAKRLIQQALLHDPALLVRDAAVESMRRIVRMRSSESRGFQGALEEAFMDNKNFMQGEGFFIRETILTLMRESGLRPSKRVQGAAKSDKNLQVQALASSWETSSF